jgi:hypothetical protein
VLCVVNMVTMIIIGANLGKYDKSNSNKKKISAMGKE